MILGISRGVEGCLKSESHSLPGRRQEVLRIRPSGLHWGKADILGIPACLPHHSRNFRTWERQSYPESSNSHVLNKAKTPSN